jgi:hypothetical protein
MAQRSFDEQLDKLGIFDLSGFGPDEAAFKDGLVAAGLQISGFAIKKATKRRKKVPPTEG